MVWSISWKNVWRNKLRSSVIIIAITLGLYGGVFAIALMMGMIEQRTGSALANEVAHIHINNPKFSYLL